MWAMFGALITSLGALFGTWKTFLGAFLIKTLLVVILYNLVSRILGEVLTWVVEKMGGVETPGAVVTSFDASGISSLGGWLLDIFKIPECMSFIIAVIVLKWSLRKIPFVRW